MSSATQRQRAASAVGGKTARACDGCARRRARWYCAADDAFLCHGCDAFVHSANPLARRHERLRLKASSSSSLATEDVDAAAPAWHHGCKRKARTPRPHQGKARSPGLVPELDTSGENNGEEEQQLLYRVPIFDPMLAEFCSPPTLDEPGDDAKPAVQLLPDYQHAPNTQCMSGILQTDAELAADVESLLAEGLHDDSLCIEGLLDPRDGRGNHCSEGRGTMKVELDHEMAVGNGAIYHVDAEVEMSGDILDIDFDCGSPTTGVDADEKKVGMAASVCGEAARVMLRLDYEAIIEAWSSNGSSPWTGGERPQFGVDDCWPEYMGVWGGGDAAWRVCGLVGAGGQVDGDREARVTRYREKRRTRLFAKKIRYEVRKLNAEKRPRMKGRFVKRAHYNIYEH